MKNARARCLFPHLDFARRRKLIVLGLLGWASLGGANEIKAGVVFGFTGSTLNGGSRWDADPRMITISGGPYERSLSGGLRYSLQGGSFLAFRNLFTWSGTAPSVTSFQGAVQQAFDAWTVIDPSSNLGSTLSFVADVATPVVGSNSGAGGLDTRGAEIDLFGSTNASFWDPGNSRTQGETRFGTVAGPLKLTSGTTNYAAPVISGSDIIMNSNPQAVYTLNLFRRILTHEIGHAIGLGDVEGSINPGAFIDDNFNGSSSSTALATLTNSWAALVNPLNPGASAGLARYTVPYDDPGTTTEGVNILMESNGVGIAAGNPVSSFFPLSPDDFSTRQFLYPVPEPTTLPALAVGGLAFMRRRTRKIQ